MGMVVTSLYTKTPNTHNLSTFEKFQTYRPCTPFFSPSAILLLPTTSSPSNHLLQVKLIDMETRMTPLWNIFTGKLEEVFLKLEYNKPKLWLSFTNDIFLLLTHDHYSLPILISWLHSLWSVHFISSSSHVAFLNVDIHVAKFSCLHLDLHKTY